MKTNRKSLSPKVAFIGNYLPRQCGIATFTTDIVDTIATQYPESDCVVLAMNDFPSGYEYPARVRFELDQEDLLHYQAAADFINLQNIEVACVQHEFGIYGGQSGSYLLTLLRNLQVPIVTTLHTILENPDPDQRAVMNELIRLSDRLIVMSHRGVDYLKKIYRVPAKKIDFIHHGIPDVPFVDPNFYKDKFHVEGKTVLLTFGLLSPNKGIEYVIEAMPSIVAQFPDTVYMVLGSTHPHVVEAEGERYRQSLLDLTQRLGVEDHVIFEDRFVSLQELVEYIGAADIYITPYLNRAQIVSGTLAYTAGAGKPVISTPYWYAEEILADERGVIVPPKDANAIAAQVIYLLKNEAERHAIRKRAYLFGRDMIWPKVAEQYMKSFDRACTGRRRNPSMFLPGGPSVPIREAPVVEDLSSDLPFLNLSHLSRMTDGTGIFQHAVFSIPNYQEGYTTDDNARALLLTLLLERLEGEYSLQAERLASRYLAFVFHAFNPDRGRFRNFMAFDRRWLEEVGSEDAHGRAMWALGTVLGQSNRKALRGVAARLFSQALPATIQLRSPRSWAFTLLGIDKYLSRFSGDRAVLNAGKTLAERLMACKRSNSDPEWCWFEGIVTYNNASLPHALLLSSRWMRRPDMMRAALEALRWLAEVQTSPEGHFIPIGSQGFYPRQGERARFDQQPVEASAMVSACLDAYQMTGDPDWLQEAWRAFRWFLGQNDLNLPVYNVETGGCHDGLHPSRVNQNEGAESTISFLMALAEMHLAQPVSRFEKTNGFHPYVEQPVMDANLSR